MVSPSSGGRGKEESPLPSESHSLSHRKMTASISQPCREQWQKPGGDLGQDRVRKQGSCTALLSAVRTISWGLEVKRGGALTPAGSLLGFVEAMGWRLGCPSSCKQSCMTMHISGTALFVIFCSRILQIPSALDLLGCLVGKHCGPQCPHHSASQWLLYFPLNSSHLFCGRCIHVLHICFSQSLQDFVQFVPFAKIF